MWFSIVMLNYQRVLHLLRLHWFWAPSLDRWTPKPAPPIFVSPSAPSHARADRDVLRAWKADPPASPPGRPSGGWWHHGKPSENHWKTIGKPLENHRNLPSGKLTEPSLGKSSMWDYQRFYSTCFYSPQDIGVSCIPADISLKQFSNHRFLMNIGLFDNRRMAGIV